MKQTLDHVLATGRGVERSFCCPVHSDTHASASVNLAKGVWVCYACKAHGKVGEDYVPELEHIVHLLTESTRVREYPETWLDIFDAHYPSPYWSQRYGEAVAEANRCGTDPLTGAPTYPMYSPTGGLWGVVTRHDTQPKYLYPRGVSVAHTLYGIRKEASVVVLVEGASDVMAMEQAGIPDSWAVLGTYGAGVHYPQIQLIADCGPRLIVCAFDDDTAGLEAAERATKQLIDVAPVITHRWSDLSVNDPGDAAINDRVAAVDSTIISHTHAVTV